MGLSTNPPPSVPQKILLALFHQRANGALLGSLAPVPKPQFVLRMWLNAFALGLFYELLGKSVHSALSG